MKNMMNEQMSLDKFDVSLLTALQADVSQTHQQLGERIGLSASQVSRRVVRLHAAGIIERSVALLNPARVGLGVRAIIYVSLVRHGGEEGLAFEREMAVFPEVLTCDAVAGEADYILQVVAGSLAQLSDSVLRKLTRIQGVNSIRSNIVLQRIKSSTELPLTQCF